jgi:hypothetical protein
VIEVARSSVDAREEARWAAMFARRPVVSRPSEWVDPVLLWFVMLIWLAMFIGSFGPWEILQHPWRAMFVRIVGAVGAVGSLRATVRMSRASRARWPRGRFLYAWGYAEIDDDVARIVPIESLRTTLRPRWLGVGPLRMLLASNALSTSFHLDAAELARVADWMDAGDASRFDDSSGGYRATPRRIAGRPAPWRFPAIARELAWAGAVAMLGLATSDVVAASAKATHHRAPRAHATRPALRFLYEDALRGREDDLAFDLDACSPTRIVISTVANYLLLALDDPRLGPARPHALPIFRASDTDARIWSRCSWQVARAQGTLDHVDLEWGLSLDDRVEVERRATIDASMVVGMVRDCRLFERTLGISPDGLARASASLARAVIDFDVLASRSPASVGDACIDTHARRIAIIDALHPD